MEDKFPFRRVLTLDPLREHWRGLSEREGLQGSLAAQVLERLDQVSGLRGPIQDPALLQQHPDLVATLFQAVFPAATHTENYAAALAPFSLDVIHMTPGFQRMGLLDRFAEHAVRQAHAPRIIVAYQHVLAAQYRTPLDIVVPIVLNATDPETGLDRFFDLAFDWRFITAKTVGRVSLLTQDQLRNLVADRMNLDLWMKLLPPSSFELHGLTIMQANDVTEQRVTARLTADLLRPDAMATSERVDALQSCLRTLLRRPALQLGLIRVARDSQDGITGARVVGKSLLLSKGTTPYCCNTGESYYARVMATREPVFVHDLACCAVMTEWETHVYEQGMRNLVIAPLIADDRLVGLIEIGSPNAGDLHVLNTSRIHEVLGLFATALKRTLDDREARVEALIKQQYTAIHPAVEWRFRKAARNYMEAGEDGLSQAPESIVFPEVYPLYGLSDIRSSSNHRAEAIQIDLLAQLDLARAAVTEAYRAHPLPALAELNHRIDTFAADVSEGLRAGDELRVLDFLRSELDDVFRQLADFGDNTAAAIRSYHDAIDADVHFLYRRRRQFEESVTIINDTISTLIDREQQHAQAMFPHYFEMYKTDGVEHSIYVGASLQEDGRFQPIYVRNLRIWQLMLICQIVWELRRVQPTMPVPLEVAHLTLVQSAPLAIRFRTEEKKFDVDGAYNIRYEIVKKRIDKARVRGTREQLTQPERIAIVYSHPREAAEYRQYLEFLHSSGYVRAEVEELDLEDLQGARGLQALRVRVAPEPPQGRLPSIDSLTDLELAGAS